MRTILFVLFSLSLILIFQTCNFQSNEKDIIPVQVQTDDLRKCCNAGRPPNCTPPVDQYSVNADCGEIYISCLCCQELWDFYGGELPPAEEIPCTIFGSYICIPEFH